VGVHRVTVPPEISVGLTSSALAAASTASVKPGGIMGASSLRRPDRQ
jgi:hypothetical protein